MAIRGNERTKSLLENVESRKVSYFSNYLDDGNSLLQVLIMKLFGLYISHDVCCKFDSQYYKKLA